MKPIRLSAHARGHIERRGFVPDEVVSAIRFEDWEPTDQNRLECRREFDYNAEWNGKYYANKQVRPIFVEEDTEIVVVTVYVYFYS